jgi:DNA-directed RNA polymerase subunit RPC12/RpoP
MPIPGNNQPQKQNPLANLLSTPLDLDPVHFVQKHRTIDGDPFVIENNGRDYLIDFYRYLCVGAIRDKRPVVVVKGRQVEMTEAALNVSLYFMYNYKFFNVLHAFPTDKQVSRFSKERLQGALEYSKNGSLKAALADHNKKSNTVSAVEFKNHNFYYMYSAWAEADSLRGISVDALMRDEFQDWTDSAIANTEMSTAQSKYAVEFSFGTPKAVGQPFERLWNQSDQRYWHPRCTKCNKLFMITLDNFIHGDIVKCPNCGQEQRKIDCNRRGQWIATKQLIGKEGRAGYHISQLIHPNIQREAITRHQVEWTDAKFKNEVLGEFFTGGALPLNERDVIQRCCEPYKDFEFASMIIPPNKTFMGIDWGGRNEGNDRGANTVVTVISKAGDKYKVEKTVRLMDSDYIKQVSRVKELIRLYNSVAVVADIGYGQVQCQMLQNEYGYLVKSCYYSPNLKSRLSYNEEMGMVSVDRNSFLEEIIDIINRGQLIIPWKDAKNTEWFIKHLCNTELKLSNRTGNVYRNFEKLNDRDPNDGLHSLNYAYIASYMHLGTGGNGSSYTSSSVKQTLNGSMVLANFNGKPFEFGKSNMPLRTRSGTGR